MRCVRAVLRVGLGGVRLRRPGGWVPGHGEGGMTTAEYAVGTIAACAFGAVLLTVVRSEAVRSALAAAITTALGLGS